MIRHHGRVDTLVRFAGQGRAPASLDQVLQLTQLRHRAIETTSKVEGAAVEQLRSLQKRLLLQHVTAKQLKINSK